MIAYTEVELFWFPYMQFVSSVLSWLRAQNGPDAKTRKLLRRVDDDAIWIMIELSSSGYVADFSVQSLGEIDRYIEDNSSDGEPRAGTFLEKDPVTVVLALGSYVGEVLRRAAGGQWVASSEALMNPFELELHLSNGWVLLPMQRVGKRLRNGAQDEILAYGRSVLEH